jgi:hypothetical protein
VHVGWAHLYKCDADLVAVALPRFEKQSRRFR